MRDSYRIGRGVVLLLLLAACGRTSGCSGCGGGGPPFPDKDRVHSAVQMRITEQGIGFFEENLEPLLAGALPDGLDVCVPGGGGDIIPDLLDWGYCTGQCDNGEEGCNLSIELGSVDLLLVEPSRVRALVVFEEFEAGFDIDAEPIVDCAINVSGPGFPLQMDLVLQTPEPTRDLTFTVEDPSYFLPALDIELVGSGDGFLDPVCDAINTVLDVPGISDVVLLVVGEVMRGPVSDLLNQFVADFTCRSCESVDDCPAAGAQCLDGVCMLGDTCLPAPLGIEGTLSTREMFGDVASLTARDLSYLATPGSYVEVEDGGLSLGLIGGAVSERNRCVPRYPQPLTDEPARSESLRANVGPTGEPFEVGFAITQLLVDHAMWAFFNSGALCLSLGAETTDQLNSRTLGVLLPGLRDVAGDEDAAIAITLSPQVTPRTTFGANIIAEVPDEDGRLVLEEPAITLVLDDLWIDFHLFVEDRWTRIFSMGVDIEMGIGLSFTPDNEVVPVLSDLSAGLSDVRVANLEIVGDDPARLEGLIPVLVGPLLPLLTGALLEPIALPDLLGFRLDLQDHLVSGIEDNQFLGIFTALERLEAPEPGGGEGARAAVQTSAVVVELHVPDTEEFALDGPDTWKRPFVRLALDAWDATRDAQMEFSWRVDGGLWSLYAPSREITVRDPLFLLQGRHNVEVRARRVDDYRTLDPTPASVGVIIDSEAPRIALEHDADADLLRIGVSDTVSPTEAIRIEVRVDDTEWQGIDTGLFSLDGATRVEVRAADEAGNVAEADIDVSHQTLIGRASRDARTNGGGGCGGGCVVAARSSAMPWPQLALGAFLLVLSIRRRRSAWVAISVVIALVSAGCGDNSKGKKDRDDPRDMGVDRPPPVRDAGHSCDTDEDCPEPNEICNPAGGVRTCVVVSCGEGADALCNRLMCDDGARPICGNNGVCQCEPFCPEGCGDGEYCCLPRNTCESVPEACADVVCDDGLELAITQGGEVNPSECVLDNAECDCVELEPLDPGRLGRHSDIVMVDGAVVVSAYAEDWGDLVVGHYTEALGYVWWWVDGVPDDGAIVAGPSGPRGGVDGDGDDVGTYTAIAADEDGALHVAYYDRTHRALRYAHGAPDGVDDNGRPRFDWSVVTVDDEGDAGRWASISVDARGVPGLAYHVGRVWDGETWVSQLRYAMARNAAPTNRVDWSAPFIVQSRILDAACGGDCGEGEVCVASSNQCASPTDNCDGCSEGERCVADVCEAVLGIPSGTETYPEGTGLFTTQARGGRDRPVVAWYDRTFGAMWTAEFEENGFGEPVMLAGWGHPDRDGDMGTNADMAIDEGGHVHLCYQDGTTDSLRYLAPSLELDEWVDDGVRQQSGGRPYAIHVVGEDCSVRLLANGEPVIVYQDSTAHEVVVARRRIAADGEVVWTPETVRGDEIRYEGAMGFYTRARLDGGTLWISHYFFNRDVEPNEEGLEIFSLAIAP